MKKLSYYLNKIKNMSFQEFIYSFYYVYLLPVKNNAIKRYYNNKTTLSYVNTKNDLELIPLFDTSINQLDIIDITCLNIVCDNYCNHYFDLLGSGWAHNGFSDDAIGLMGYRYDGLVLNRDKDEEWLKNVLTESDAEIAKDLFKHISPDYLPIDWQKDFKTGYRWSAKDWYRPIKYINAESMPGIDIKVPWELSRLQHLTRIAVLYANKDTPNEKRNKLGLEYQNQCLDFIAQNPPKRGVNWYCTMDVGIRLANIAISYSILKSAGCTFDSYFEKILFLSVKEHCKFIKKNLEWSPSCRSNHYLSDICGLLFGASILPEKKYKKKWLKFAICEIRKELPLQFHEDGSNFEASVAYHRLSAELILFSMALICRYVNNGITNPFTKREINVAKKMGLFLKDMTLPNGTIYQCGDNDSGRFINPTPLGEVISTEEVRNKYITLKNYNEPNEDAQQPWRYFDESVNRPDGTISAWAGLFNIQDSVKEKCKAEVCIIRALMKDYIINQSEEKQDDYNNLIIGSDKEPDISNLLYVESIFLPFSRPLSEMPFYLEYPDFGVTVLRSEEVYLAINWSDNGQNGNAGHTHNDKLSFELWDHGYPVIRDPGTFVYTPLPQLRNVFRSINAHNCMRTKREQNEYISLFSMQNESKCRIIERESNQEYIRLIYELKFSDIVQRRSFYIDKSGIRIEDKSTESFIVDLKQCIMAEGYGKLTRFSDEAK